MTNEGRRQLLHVSMTAFALLLPWLAKWPVAAPALAGVAVLVNWLLLPALGWDKGLRREGGPFVDGVKLYPVAVLAVLLLFPTKPQAAAAAAWGVMGVGDAASNVIGRRFGRPGFVGRADRSLVGTAAFVVFGFLAAWGLATWVGAPAETSWKPALAAAVAGAVAELVTPAKLLDDNLPIALAAGAAFHLTA
jgi:dolichol kinase